MNMDTQYCRKCLWCLLALRRQEKATFTHYCKQVVSTPEIGIGTLVHKDLHKNMYSLVKAKPLEVLYSHHSNDVQIEEP